MLELSLLGSPQIMLDGRTVDGLGAKSQALLFYLALSRRPQSRQALAALLWPEKGEADALANLRQSLHQLGRSIPGCLVNDRATVGLAPEQARLVDAVIFEEQVAETNPIATQQAGIDRYAGEFLAGFHVREAAPFEEWQTVTRERLHHLALQTLRRLVAHCVTGQECGHGLRYANRLLALEPWDEETHRHKMLLLAWDGQRQAALDHYVRCRRVLAEELGTDPEPETVALYEQIRGSQAVAGVQPAAGRAPAQAVTAPTPSWGTGSAVADARGLPVAATSFIGRSRELAELAARLADPQCRLLSIIGLGGIGKTRLAIEAARQAAPTFTHGACYVPLAALSDTGQVAPAIAAALGVAGSGDSDPQMRLVEYLAPRRLLLVLDNLEHLADCARLIVLLLAAAPAVTVFCTTRTRLNLQTEWTYEVLGLDVPRAAGVPADRPADSALASIAAAEAVQLFVQRAQRARSFFALTPDNAEAVARICQLTGGMPLALELAASWIHVLSCQEIADEIESNLAALATTAHDIPDRHRSVESVFESSWRRLSTPEQHALMVMAIFRGGFDRRAASAVAKADLQVLAGLISHSLVQRTAARRYAIHELLAQFLRSKLAAQPALVSEAQAAHAHFYAAFLQSYRDLEVGAVTSKVQEVELDFENIRWAWQWLVQHAADPGAITWLDSMVDVLHDYFDLRSQYREGAAWFAEALAGLERTAPDLSQATVLLRGRLMSRLARFHYYLGNFAETRQLAQRSLEIATQHDQPTEIAFCLMRFGYLANSDGDYSEAIQHFNAARDLYAGASDRTGVVWALNGIGIAHYNRGNLRTGRDFFLDAYHQAQALDNLMLRTITLHNLGRSQQEVGAYSLALASLRECLQLNEYLDDQEGVGYARWSMASALIDLGEVEAAQQHAAAALAIFREIGHQRGVAYVLAQRGTIARLAQDFVVADHCLHEAQSIVQRLRLNDIVPLVTFEKAKLSLAQNHLSEAHALAADALQQCKSSDMRYSEGFTYALLGDIAAAQLRWSDARAYFAAAAALACELETPSLLLEAIAGQARALAGQEDYERAAVLLTFACTQSAMAAAARSQAQEALNAVRNALAPAAWVRSQQAAAALTLDTVPAYTLIDLGLTQRSASHLLGLADLDILNQPRIVQAQPIGDDADESPSPAD